MSSDLMSSSFVDMYSEDELILKGFRFDDRGECREGLSFYLLFSSSRHEYFIKHEHGFSVGMMSKI